jgi:hypothetical protein
LSFAALTPAAPPKRHKVVLVAPGCGGFKASGTPATPSPAAALPSPPSLFELRRGKVGRHISGARAVNPAPASPSLATGPLGGGPFFQPHRHACAAPGCRAPSRCPSTRCACSGTTHIPPRRPVRSSATRCAGFDAYGPSLWRERPPSCARLARALAANPRGSGQS